MPKITFNTRSVPIALLLVCILSFGLLIPWLGFYQDDWYLIWFARFFGPKVFIDFFANERPFLAGIYMITTTLVRHSALAWQIFALLTRWLAALAAWWTLRTLWPRQVIQVTWITLLFVVYPGFKQQYVAVVYSQDFIILAAFIFSLGTMLWAVRLGRAAKTAIWQWPLTLLSVLLAIFVMVSSEYFFGMELLRPLFLWFAISNDPDEKDRDTSALRPKPGGVLGALNQHRDRARQTFLYWLPYLLAAAGFVFWRVFIFKFVTYQPKLALRLSANPAIALFQLVQTMIEDAFDVSFFAWEQTLDIARKTTASPLSVFLHWAVILACAALVIFYLSRLRPTTLTPTGTSDVPPFDKLRERTSEINNTQWVKQALVIGGISLIAGGWPFWFTSLPIQLEEGFDRFTLAFMFGVSIFIVGLVEWLIKTPRQKVVLIGLMVGLAAGMHNKIANSYRQVHAAQESFFQQMVWRIPGLQPGTVLIMNPFPYDNSGPMSLTAAANWIYASEYKYPNLYYRILVVPDHLGKELPDLKPGLKIEHPYRSLTFRGSTSQAIVLYYDPPRCLMVMDPQAYATLPKIPPLISKATPLTNLDQIIASDDQSIQREASLFGGNLPADWCYYFEKADLARQLEDWEQIVQLGNRAFKGLPEPEGDNVMELLPFVEGYGRTGNFDKANRLTDKAVTTLPLMRHALCRSWQGIQQNTTASPERDKILANLAKKLDCSLEQTNKDQ